MNSAFSNLKKHLPYLLGLIALYFLTRLPNLLNIPIFTDEAIYLRWSQIGSVDPLQRFIPLTDGKPPLYHWILMVLLRVIEDPLYAGRIISVFSGFFNAILTWLLTLTLFRRRTTAHLATLFYILSPFMLVYDRLAIVDSLLTTFSLSSLFLAVLLVKHLRLDTALLLGASIGAGMLTKASGLIFLLLTPLTLLVNRFDRYKLPKHILTWTGFVTIAFVISQASYSILRLSALYFRIGQKNDEFLIPLSQFLNQPFALTLGNAKSLLQWQIGYLSIPIALLVLLAFIKKNRLPEKLLLLGYYLIPLLMIATFNKIIFPRFLLFSTPFLLILAAAGFRDLTSNIKTPFIGLGFLFLAILIPAQTVWQLHANPLKANIIQADRDQYLDSWSAGWGINQIVHYLDQQSKDQPIYVGTQGTFGLMPFALEIYLHQNQNIYIQSFWPVTTLPQEVVATAQDTTTFFIYNELEDIPPQDNLELIMEFRKDRLGEIRHLRLFKVKASQP